MSVVSVPAEETPRLQLGGVCAKSGAPATQLMSMHATYTPGWIWILIFFGLIPMLIAYVFTKQSIAIDVPASDDVIRRRSRATARMVGAGLVSMALVVAAAFIGETALAWIGIVGLVAVTMALPFWARTWITVTYNGEVVTLSRVHPNYVAAIGFRR